MEKTFREVKRCFQCKELKLIDGFHKNKARSDGRDTRCITCTSEYKKERGKLPEVMAAHRRASSRARAKNITGFRLRDIDYRDEKYAKIYKVEVEYYRDFKSKTSCAICNRSIDPSVKSGKKKPHVDHCHETGIIRDTLCHNCNLGLGNFSDNVGVMKNAIDYIVKHRFLHSSGNMNPYSSDPLSEYAETVN